MAEMCVGSGSLGAGLEEPAMERGATSYGPTDEAAPWRGAGTVEGSGARHISKGES